MIGFDIIPVTMASRSEADWGLGLGLGKLRVEGGRGGAARFFWAERVTRPSMESLTGLRFRTRSLRKTVLHTCAACAHPFGWIWETRVDRIAIIASCTTAREGLDRWMGKMCGHG